jgi:hypothetical protein
MHCYKIGQAIWRVWASWTRSTTSDSASIPPQCCMRSLNSHMYTNNNQHKRSDESEKCARITCRERWHRRTTSSRARSPNRPPRPSPAHKSQQNIGIVVRKHDRSGARKSAKEDTMARSAFTVRTSIVRRSALCVYRPMIATMILITMMMSNVRID